MTRYTTEMRERALRMLGEARVDHPNQMTAIRYVAGLLKMSPETLRVWQRRYEVDTGARPRVTSDVAEENRRLKRENAELKRANEILKAASVFLPRNSTAPRRNDSLHRSDARSFRGRGHLPGAAPGRWWVSDLSRVSCGQGSTRFGPSTA